MIGDKACVKLFYLSALESCKDVIIFALCEKNAHIFTY